MMIHRNLRPAALSNNGAYTECREGTMSGTGLMHKDRKARKAAIERLAQDLQVSVRTVKDRKIVEKTLESVQKRAETAENAQKHREKCQKYAQMVQNRQITLKRAAFMCEISERQMRRYVAALEE